MKIVSETSAQAGGIWMFVLGIFIIGFFYVAFGQMMAQFQSANNALITSSNIPYSQDHWNSIDILFKYWWSVPVFAIILFAIYGIKNALTKDPNEV